MCTHILKAARPSLNHPDPTLIRALAASLVQRPGASLTELAKGAGISRATLYRLAPTRSAILAMLMSHAFTQVDGALSLAEGRKDDPKAGLEAATAAMLDARDLIVLLFYQFGEEGKNKNDLHYSPPEWAPLDARLDAFFLSGQKAGAFTIEMPAPWLSDFYWTCLYGAAWSIARGRMAPASALSTVMRSFLRGIT